MFSREKPPDFRALQFSRTGDVVDPLTTPEQLSRQGSSSEWRRDYTALSTLPTAATSSIAKIVTKSAGRRLIESRRQSREAFESSASAGDA